MSSIAFRQCLDAIAASDIISLEGYLRSCPEVVAERDPEERTLLLNACFPLFRVADADVVRVLLAAGSDVHVSDYTGSNCLHGIVLMHNRDTPQPVAEIASMLVSAGLNVNAVDNHGNSPLWKAVLECRPGTSFAAVEALLRLGASRELKNRASVSPLDLAEKIQGRHELLAFLRNFPPPIR